MRPHEGQVLLVGAGPGAADLLTVRALRALQEADVVLHDSLVTEEILDCIPARVRRIAVGKRGHRPSTPQDFINRLMVRLARGGAKVVRLKGGDPSMFGRSGEERTFLEALGVSVRTIPGVTSASAAAAQFGFSLTERAHARRVLFATGRAFDGAELDWSSAADPQATVCIYMGCAQANAITERLLALGRSRETPVVVAIDVERPGARLLRTSLSALPLALEDLATGAPVLIVVGDACASASAQEEAALSPKGRNRRWW